jgi:hypothetical protein
MEILVLHLLVLQTAVTTAVGYGAMHLDATNFMQMPN